MKPLLINKISFAKFILFLPFRSKCPKGYCEVSYERSALCAEDFDPENHELWLVRLPRSVSVNNGIFKVYFTKIIVEQVREMFCLRKFSIE